MASKPKLGENTTLGTGGWNGVETTNYPYDDAPNLLTDALNGYFPDPINGSEFAARPAFVNNEPPSAMTAAGGQVFSVQTGANIYNFIVMNPSGGPKLYRVTSSTSTPFTPIYTDVSPVGITITMNALGGNASTIYMAQLGGDLIFSDGVNRPWVGTNLGNTPITGTYIDADGSGTSWVAIGEPTVYVDSVFFISGTTFSNVTAGVGILWCEPNSPSTGYMQSGFADFWNLIQTSDAPLFALRGTNSGLYFFRQNSIGVLTGTPSVNFQASASQDTVSYNVGCIAAKTIKSYGNYLYFADAVGRPWRMAIGGVPEPIWLKMRQAVENAQAIGFAHPSVLQVTAWAVMEPTLNKYVLFTFANHVTGTGVMPITGYVFDGVSGAYEGRWQIADWNTETAQFMYAGGVIYTSTLIPSLAILGSGPTSISNNHLEVWVLQPPETNVWADGTGAAPTPILAQTQRLGYSASVEWDVNTVRAVTNNQTPVSLDIVASTGTVGPLTSTPPASNDGTNLAQFAPVGAKGRGIQLQLSPTTTTSQWRLFRAEIDVTGANVQMSDG